MNREIINYKSAFDNLIKLDEMILQSANRLQKSEIEKDKSLVSKIINGDKPPHLTDEQWEYYKKVGERLLNI